MFFQKKRKSVRYGRRPVLTSSSGKRSLRSNKNNIPSISFPSLATIKKILLALVIFVILAATTYTIFLSPYFKVSKIFIQYDEFQNENADLLGKFDDLKGKNILFVDPKSRIDEVKKANPQLEKLFVEKVLPNTIKMSFSEFPIAANIERVVNGKSAEKVLINAVGMVVYHDTENPNLPYIKVVTKEAIEDPAPSANPILSQENLSYILSATSNFEQRFGMKILETQLYPQARELHIKTEKNFFIWLDIQIPFERQFLKLKKAMSLIDIYKQPLEYIDLRVSGTNGEKVIFKRKK